MAGGGVRNRLGSAGHLPRHAGNFTGISPPPWWHRDIPHPVSLWDVGAGRATSTRGSWRLYGRPGGVDGYLGRCASGGEAAAPAGQTGWTTVGEIAGRADPPPPPTTHTVRSWTYVTSLASNTWTARLDAFSGGASSADGRWLVNGSIAPTRCGNGGCRAARQELVPTHEASHHHTFRCTAKKGTDALDAAGSPTRGGLGRLYTCRVVARKTGRVDPRSAVKEDSGVKEEF